MLSSNLFAMGNNVCKPWEAGDVVKDDQKNDLNVPGQSPPAFCWQAAAVAGAVRIGDTLYVGTESMFEDFQTATQHNFFSYYTKDIYGTNYVGVYAWVKVYGFPQDTPKVTFGSQHAVLVDVTNITSPSGDILNGKLYKFFVKHKTTSSIGNILDQDMLGNLYIYDNGWNLKQTLKIN